MSKVLPDEYKPDWFTSGEVKPFIFARKENRSARPGIRNKCDWFGSKFLEFDPLRMDSSRFGHQIMTLDNLAFGQQEMATPPWVFYDCGVLPGIIMGYAARADSVSKTVKKILKVKSEDKWVPVSMFIAIPTVQKNAWMAHNLASINSVLGPEERYRHLGFLTKAFALWYANMERLYGVTQWHSPAIKLHPCYGEFELVSTYTRLHDYPNSVTYSCIVKTEYWKQMFDRTYIPPSFKKKFKKSSVLDPKDKEAIKKAQRFLEKNSGALYLSGHEVLNKKLGEKLGLYKKIKSVK